MVHNASDRGAGTTTFYRDTWTHMEKGKFRDISCQQSGVHNISDGGAGFIWTQSELVQDVKTYKDNM
jgi:hypothetical protein